VYYHISSIRFENKKIWIFLKIKSEENIVTNFIFWKFFKKQGKIGRKKIYICDKHKGKIK